MKKNIFALMICVVMLLALAACKSNDVPAPADEPSVKETEEVEIPGKMDGIDVTIITDDKGRPGTKKNGEFISLDEYSDQGYDVSYDLEGVVNIVSPEAGPEGVNGGDNNSTGNDVPDNETTVDVTTQPNSPDTTQTQNPETIGSNSNPEANIDAEDASNPAPEASNPTQENSDTSKDDPYAGPVVTESISFLDAGCYVDDATLAAAGIRPRPTLDKNDDVNAAVDKLNGFVFDTYGRRYLQRGIGLNHNAGQQIAMIIKDGDTWGMRVFSWRKSYDSDAALNAGLNVALEGMRYLSGDKEVASALWRVVDYMSMHSGNIPNDMIESFGFSVSNETSNSIDLTMNGQTIHWVAKTDGNYFYFN